MNDQSGTRARRRLARRRRITCAQATGRRTGQPQYVQSRLCRSPARGAPKSVANGNHMNRLPSYDIRTSRAERGFFLGLSLAALALVAITASDAVQFAEHRQEIAVALSIGQT